MTSLNSQPNSKNFSFSEEVKVAFSFLEKEYDFSFVIIEAPDIARFESINLTIEFRRFSGHDPAVYFMNVSFNNKGGKLEFEDLVRHGNPALTSIEVEALTAPRNYPATTLEETQRSLYRMVELIRQYCIKIL